MNKNPTSIYKIRFNDCDMFGHLNNSSYLDYLINAREDHLKDEYNFDVNEYYKNDLAWVIGSHEIVYVKPAVYNEMVVIQSCLLQVENELLHIETVMMNEKQNHVKAIMRSKLIPIKIKTGKKESHKLEFLNWAKSLVNTEINNLDSLQDRIKKILTDIKI